LERSKSLWKTGTIDSHLPQISSGQVKTPRLLGANKNGPDCSGPWIETRSVSSLLDYFFFFGAAFFLAGAFFLVAFFID
jgi:hypothetical protein